MIYWLVVFAYIAMLLGLAAIDPMLSVYLFVSVTVGFWVFLIWGNK